MLGRSLGGERKHGHTRLDAGHRLRGLGRANGNLCQLFGVGHGRDRHVAHHHHAVLTVFGGLGEEEHRTAHAGDAGSRFDDLECGTQHVAGGVKRAGQLSVGIAGFDHQAAQIERIFHQHARLLEGHAFLGAELRQELCVGFFLGVVERVDHRGLFQVLEAFILCQFGDFCGVPDQDQIGHTVGQDTVGGLNRAFFRAFGQDDALLVGSGASHQLFYQCHCLCISIRWASVGFVQKEHRRRYAANVRKKTARAMFRPHFLKLCFAHLRFTPVSFPTTRENLPSFFRKRGTAAHNFPTCDVPFADGAFPRSTSSSSPDETYMQR